MADEQQEGVLFTLTPEERELFQPEMEEIARCTAIIASARGSIMRAVALKAGRRDISLDFRTFTVSVVPPPAVGAPAGLSAEPPA